MNLLQMRDRIIDVQGDAQTSEVTFYNRLINDAILTISSITSWWWLEKQTVIAVNAPLVTKNLICTLGSTSITPDAGQQIGVEYIGAFLSDGTHTYRILGIVGAPPYTITIDAAFLEASATYACSVVKCAYDLPQDYNMIRSVAPRRAPNSLPLAYVDPMEIEANGPDFSMLTAESARMYTVFRTNSIDTKVRIGFYPAPSVATQYLVRYQSNPSALVLDTDSSELPEQFHPMIVDRAILDMMIICREDPDVVSNWWGKYNTALTLLWKEQHARGDKMQTFGRRGVAMHNPIPVRIVTP